MKVVSSQWLSAQITSNPESILLLDTRSSDEFNAGSIAGSVSVYCCGALILRRLKKGTTSVESLLSNEEDKEKYSQAKSSERYTVVVYDQSSPSHQELASDCLASVILKKLTRDVKNVTFLGGGYHDFSVQCSQLCSSQERETKQASLLESRPSSLVLQLKTLSLSSDSDSGQSSSDSDDSQPSTPVTTKRNPQPFEILPHLYLSCRKAASNRKCLENNSISRILNVTSEESEYQHLDGFSYFQIAVEDSHEVNMLQHLPLAFSFIEEARLANEKVLVHCHAGMSRSVTVVIAYLMKYYEHTLNSAYDFVRQKKSNISPNFSFLEQLLQFECSLRPSPADSGIDSSSSSPCSLMTFNSPANLNTSDIVVRRCILAA